jgi:hypothetical protein
LGIAALRQCRHHPCIAAGGGQAHRLLGGPIGGRARGAGGQQHVRHLFDAGELVHRAHQVTLRTLLQAAAGDVDVLLRKPVDHAFQRQAVLRKLALVDVDLHFVFQAATDLHRGHAVDGFELALEVVIGEAAQLHQLADAFLRAARLPLRRQRKAHDRLGGRIEAQQHRRLGVQRELQRLHLVAHVQAGLIHVGAPGEFQHHVGLAGARDRLQLAQALDHAEGFLGGLRDQGLDFRRRGAFVVGTHGQGGIAQVGKQIDLQAAQRDQAEQHQGQRHHRDGDATAGGEFDQTEPAGRNPWDVRIVRTHCAAARGAGDAAALLAPMTCTALPSRSADLPATTTSAPSRRPARTSTHSPST